MFKFIKSLGNKSRGESTESKASNTSSNDGEKDKETNDLKPFEFNLNVDSAVSQDNMLIMHGWVYCAKTRIKKIEIVYKDKTSVLDFGLHRPDVMDTFEHCKYVDSGFHFVEHISSNEIERAFVFIATGENGKVYKFNYEVPVEHWNPGTITMTPAPHQKEVGPYKIHSKVFNGIQDIVIKNKEKPRTVVSNKIEKEKLTEEKPDFRIHVDQSSTKSNMLIMQGWAYCEHTKIRRIEVVYNDSSKDALIGFERSDVQKAYNDCAYSNTGFYFQNYIDYTGSSTKVKFYLHGENNQIFEFDYELSKPIWFPKAKNVNINREYKKYFSQYGIDYRKKKALELSIDKFKSKPLITIIVPVYNVDIKWIEIAIQSIVNQIYTNWELLLIDDKSTSESLIEYLKELDHPKISVHFSKKNGGISKATNIGISKAKGDYVLFMDNDDRLDLTALYEVAFALDRSPDSEIIYSDEDKIDTKEVRSSPVYKPDWSPEFLLTTNYFNHILCVKRELCEQVPFRSEFDGCQDWDFILRLSDLSDKVYHIPKVLYNWRTLEGSIASSGDAKENMSFFAKCEKTINQHLQRNDINGKAKRPEFALASGAALFEVNSLETEISDLSIIIYLHSSNDELIKSIADTLKNSNSEILIYWDEEPDRIKEVLSSMNFGEFTLHPSQGRCLSEIYNDGAEKSKYNNLLFLDQRIDGVDKQLILNLLLFSARDKMGVLGTKLLESDNTIHSTGYILGQNNDVYNDLYPSKAFNKEVDDSGYFFFKQIMRNYSAIPKEFFFVKKKLFNQLNGFDESSFNDALFDVDFCLRASDIGYRHLSLPGSTIIKIEEEDEFNIKDLKRFYDRYGILSDPLYNPNFSKFDQFDFKLVNRSSKNELDSKIRILFCTHNLNFEGAPIHIFEIIEQMLNSNERNYEIEIYSPHDGPLKERYLEIGVEVRLLPHLISTNPNDLKSEVHFERNITQIAKWLNSNSYDLVFCNTILSFEFILASDIANIPTIWNIHESTPISAFLSNKNINFNSKLELAFSSVSDIVFSSKNTADLYRHYLKRNNYSIITNGIKEDAIRQFKEINSKKLAREELGIEDDSFVFLSLGSFGARKGQMDFVAAAIELLKEAKNYKELTFVLVGADKLPAKFSYTYNINSLIEESGFKDNFKVLPVVPDVNKYYLASDVFVCSSYNESSPRVILIAMLFDLPIITTPVYGIKEQVIENQNALYYGPGDIDKLSMCMKRLCDDRDLLVRLAENSNMVLSLSNSHKQMVEAYSKLIKIVY